MTFENAWHEHYSDQEMDEIVKLALVAPGTRLAVFWYNQDAYYHATVTKQRNQKQAFCVKYDNGAGREWMDLRRHKFFLLPPGSTSSSTRNSSTSPGSGIGTGSSNVNANVNDEGESNEPPGTSHKGDENNNTGRGCSPDEGDISARLLEPDEFVDSSDDEIAVLTKENPNMALVHIGTRVSVWWLEEAQYFHGTVTHVRKTNKKPFYIEYDDGEFEWIDLSQHKFCLLLPLDENKRKARQVAPQKNTPGESVAPESETKRTRKGATATYGEHETKAASKTEVHVPNRRPDSNPSSQDATVESRAVTEESGVINMQVEVRENAEFEPEAESDADAEMEFATEPGETAQYAKAASEKGDKSSESDAEADAESSGNDSGSERDESPDISRVTIGSRVGVWWKEDKRYYDAEVIDRQRGPKPLRLKYKDDGVQEWINLRLNKFRLLTGDKCKRSKGRTKRQSSVSKSEAEDANTQPPTKRQPKRSRSRAGAAASTTDADNDEEERVEASPDVALVSVGSRVAVWWSEDQKYYSGTVMKERTGEKLFYLEYDDGEKEWINFLNHRFRLLRDSKRRNSLRVPVESGPDSNDSDNKLELSPDVGFVAVGSRVAVWWSEDRKYYPGIVKEQSEGKLPFFLKYDDGETEWINFRNHRFRLETKRKAVRVDRRKKRPEFKPKEDSDSKAKDIEVSVGTRVAVWWLEDRRYYRGIVTKQRKRKPSLFLEYDDGEEEWIDFRDHEFLVLANGSDKSATTDNADNDDKPSRPSKKRKTDASPPSTRHRANPDMALVDIGSRVSVWWSGDEEFFDGTITRKRETKRSKKPFHVEYDDGDHEWIDLAKHTFRMLPEGKPRGGSKSKRRYSEADQMDVSDASNNGKQNALSSKTSTKKAHKKGDLEDYNDLRGSTAQQVNHNRKQKVVSTNRQSRKKENKSNNLDVKTAASATRSEECLLCKASVMKNPRATDCHHLFCESCIEGHFNNDPRCPVCKHSFGNDLQLSNEADSPVSFRAVERIDMVSGESHVVYSSASAASRKVRGGKLAFRILGACESKRKDGREYGGSLWRFHESKQRVRRADKATSDGVAIAIEQVDPKTNKVIKTFPSSRKAHEVTGVARCSIRRVLDRKGKANAGGFF